MVTLIVHKLVSNKYNNILTNCLFSPPLLFIYFFLQHAEGKMSDEHYWLFFCDYLKNWSEKSAAWNRKQTNAINVLLATNTQAIVYSCTLTVWKWDSGVWALIGSDSYPGHLESPSEGWPSLALSYLCLNLFHSLHVAVSQFVVLFFSSDNPFQ